MTNRDRAHAGELALDAFTRRTYGGRWWHDLHPEDRITAVYDLICDLMHTCRLDGILEPDGDETTEGLFDSAMRHYEVERQAGWDDGEDVVDAIDRRRHR